MFVQIKLLQIHIMQAFPADSLCNLYNCDRPDAPLLQCNSRLAWFPWILATDGILSRDIVHGPNQDEERAEQVGGSAVPELYVSACVSLLHHWIHCRHCSTPWGRKTLQDYIIRGGRLDCYLQTI